MRDWLSKLPRHCLDRIFYLVESDDVFQIALAYPSKCRNLLKNVKKTYELQLFKPLLEIKNDVKLLIENLNESISSVKVVQGVNL